MSFPDLRLTFERPRRRRPHVPAGIGWRPYYSSSAGRPRGAAHRSDLTRWRAHNSPDYSDKAPAVGDTAPAPFTAPQSVAGAAGAAAAAPSCQRHQRLSDFRPADSADRLARTTPLSARDFCGLPSGGGGDLSAARVTGGGGAAVSH